MKKIWLLFLLVAVLALAGCGSDDGDNVSGVTTGNQTTNTTSYDAYQLVGNVLTVSGSTGNYSLPSGGPYLLNINGNTNDFIIPQGCIIEKITLNGNINNFNFYGPVSAMDITGDLNDFHFKVGTAQPSALVSGVNNDFIFDL